MCMAVATSAVRAQSPISFYAEAGIGTSRLYGKHSGSDTQIACKAGIGAEYALNKTWTLRSALEFVSIGGRDDMDYVRNAGMNELYLQIPVRVAARLPLGKDYHASLNVGPYIACGVGGKTASRIITAAAPPTETGGSRWIRLVASWRIMPETGGWTAVSSWESLWNTAGSSSVQRHRWGW